MREYDDEILAKVQQAELSILKDFLKICEDNNLKCFGWGGTAIGAIRHGGFIPWDDDIDVGLLREDYEKALEIIKRDYADKYTVVNGDEFSTYPLMTTRVTLNDSQFVENCFKKIKCPLGIFLDVYAFDKVSTDPKKAKRQALTAWFFGKLLILKHIPFPVLMFGGFKKFLVYCVTALVWLFLNVFGFSHKFLYNKAKKASCKYNHLEADTYAYFFDTNWEGDFFDAKDLFPLRKEKFEDTDLYFPCNVEKSLEAIYGDFMQLPPPEKRKNHFPYILKFPGEEPITSE